MLKNCDPEPVLDVPSDPSIADVERKEMTRLIPDVPIARLDAAPGHPTHERVLGADADWARSEPTYLDEAGLPTRGVGLIGDEREDVFGRPRNDDLSLDGEHLFPLVRVTRVVL